MFGNNWMGYGGGYPMPNPDNLMQMRQQQMAQTMPQAQRQEPPIIWVQGLEGAKSYLVAPGCSQLLMDSEGSCFYIKSTDAAGMPLPLRIFDYNERTQAMPVQTPLQQNTVDPSQFITREEFARWQESFMQNLRMAAPAEQPVEGGAGNAQ